MIVACHSVTFLEYRTIPSFFLHRSSCFPDIFLNLEAKRNIAATTVPFPNLQALNRPKIGGIKLRNYLHFVPRSRNQVPQLNDHDIPSKRLFSPANEAISTPSILHRNFVRLNFSAKNLKSKTRNFYGHGIRFLYLKNVLQFRNKF